MQHLVGRIVDRSALTGYAAPVETRTQKTDGSVREGTTTVERVAHDLRQDVLEGRLPPGARLRDQKLADRFGVSRNTLRDALRLLSVEGLVVSRLHAGSEVRRLTPEDV